MKVIRSSTLTHDNTKPFGKLFCPTCREPLEFKKLLDILTQGFECKNKHPFFVNLFSPDSFESAKAIDLEALKVRTDEDIMKAWLTDPALRKHLNTQLAETLRRIYEIQFEAKHIFYEKKDLACVSTHFHFCPLCKNTLVSYDQPDIGSLGLKCKNNHEFRYRSGLRFGWEIHGIRLKKELDNHTIQTRIKGWLDPKNKALRSQLPNQIEHIFKKYVNQLGVEK